MNKYLKIVMAIAIGLSLTACQNELDEDQLIGKWKDSSCEQYYRFSSDGKGKFWDEGEGTYESYIKDGENGSFSWTLDGKSLKIIHNSTMSGGAVPENCTIKTLTSSELSWDSSLHGNKTFVKQ